MGKNDKPIEPPATEPISVPDAAPRAEAPPSWLTEDSAKVEESPLTTEQDAIDTGDVIVDLIKDLHHKAAEATFYDGFEISEGMVNNWRKLLKVLLRRLPSKDWPLAICAVSLLIGYALMVTGYMRYRKESAGERQVPTRVPKGILARGGAPTPDAADALPKLTGTDREHIGFVGPTSGGRGPPQFLPDAMGGAQS